MADRVLEVQAAIVARLVADAGVHALVADRIYDRVSEGVTFPYIQIGDAVVLAFDAQGLRGQEINVSLHAWSRKPGRVECRQIMAAIYIALHWHNLSLSSGALVLCRESGRRDMDDPDGVTSHGVIDFTIITDG